MLEDKDRIEKRILELESSMDAVMQQSRTIIRTAAKLITAMHAKRMDEAREGLEKLKSANANLKKSERGFEHYSLQAHQEYSEAEILYRILTTGKVPSASQIGEDEIAYLLGLMDVVGELKREAFDSMRDKDVKKAELYYGIMLDIYDSTISFRSSSAVLPDFRRKQDVARIQIESTIGELVRRDVK